MCVCGLCLFIAQNQRTNKFGVVALSIFSSASWYCGCNEIYLPHFISAYLDLDLRQLGRGGGGYLFNISTKILCELWFLICGLNILRKSTFRSKYYKFRKIQRVSGNFESSHGISFSIIPSNFILIISSSNGTRTRSDDKTHDSWIYFRYIRKFIRGDKYQRTLTQLDKYLSNTLYYKLHTNYNHSLICE